MVNSRQLRLAVTYFDGGAVCEGVALSVSFSPGHSDDPCRTITENIHDAQRKLRLVTTVSRFAIFCLRHIS